MSIKLEFSTQEELNVFCKNYIIKDLFTSLQKTYEIKYENTEIIKYFQQRNFKLNDYQWRWLFEFNNNKQVLKSDLPRQCGKTFFLAGLSSYLISQEKKIIFFARNLDMLNYFKQMMYMFEPRQKITQYFCPILMGNSRPFNIRYDYIIGDEVDYYDVLPTNYRFAEKHIFLGS